MAIEHIKFHSCEVDVEAAYRLTGVLHERYPQRAPAVVAHAMRPYIEGRIVCDLGCGGGDLLWLMSRYASKAIGVEIDHSRGRHAEARAACTDSMEFLRLDYFQAPVPRADVYYAWPNDPDTFAAIAERLIQAACSPCLFAAGAGADFLESERNPSIVSVENRLRQGRQCHVLSLVEKYGGEVVTFPFKEDSARREWSGTGTWGLAMITL